MGLESIYYVFGVHPQENGEVHHTLKGKFWLNNGDFRLLEDHGISPGHDLECLPPAAVSALIQSMQSSQRRLVVSAEDLRQGLYPDLLPDITKPRGMPADLREAMGLQINDPEEQEKTSMFDYHRTGMPAAQQLEVRGTKAFLDGQALSPEELKQVMGNVSSGNAKLRHRLAKTDLAKSDPVLMSHMKSVSPDQTNLMVRTMFHDTLIPSIGNRKAYKEFLSEAPPGVHVHINANDMWHLNKTHGPETGNLALAAIGKAVGQSMEESAGKKARAFRTGGDNFVVHVPKHEDAALFARNLRTKLEGIPTVRGTHKLSVSMGLGDSAEQAHEAMKTAKAKKIANQKILGQSESHIHSYSTGLPNPSQPI
jgi:GGDEF domain-containing protein